MVHVLGCCTRVRLFSVALLPYHVARIDLRRARKGREREVRRGKRRLGVAQCVLSIEASLCRFLSFIPLFRPFLFPSPLSGALSFSTTLSLSLVAEGSSLVPLPFGRSPFVYTRYRFSLSPSACSRV